MKDHSKKLNEIKESNESVFEGIFGFGKKEQPESVSSGDGFVEKIAEGKYRMGKSIITGLRNATESGIMNYRWDDSKLNWLLDCEFEGVLNLDLRNEVLNAFAGIWKSGVFRGSTFSNSSTSLFEGGEFGVSGNIKPRFVPSYDRWKASPVDFADGTILRETGGILGIENAPNGPITGEINIISILPGRSMSIKLRSNVVHKINFLKRIDSVSSDFVVEIENGETNKKTKEVITWDKFRANNGALMMFNPSKSISILELNLSDKIVSANLINTGSASLKVSSPTLEQTPEKTEQELAVTQQQYDLNRAPFLGIKKLGGEYWNEKGILVKNNVGRVYFHAPNNEYLTQFENVVRNLDNNVLSSDFSQLRANLASKVITGAPKGYPWLANLIGVDTSGNQVEDKSFVGSLNRIEAFLKYFVATIVKYAGKSKREKGNTNVPNTEIQELIKTNLKNYLGIKTPEAAPISTTSAAPAQKPQSKISVKEGIVKSVKDIISERL